MARSRHALPRRPLDRLPFSPSVEELRHKRGFDDTIKLSVEYLSSLDGNTTEPDSDSVSIAEFEFESEPEPEPALSASSSTSQDPATAPVSSSTSAACLFFCRHLHLRPGHYLYFFVYLRSQSTHRYSTGPTHPLQQYLPQPEFIHPAPKDDPPRAPRHG